MSAMEPNQVNSTAQRLSTVFVGSSLLTLGLSVSTSLGLVQIIIGVVATPA